MTLPLRQHIGAPSVPVVTAGQSVTKGDLVAKIPEDALGANIHASISGVIAEVSDSAIVITRGGCTIMIRAIGLVEFVSIAKGIEAADAMLKAANIELLEAKPICPGKYIVLICGDVSAVENSVNAGRPLAAAM